MPTVITRTIKSTGGDYSSLSAWDAANGGATSADLVANDEALVAVCDAFTDSAGILIINGYTTDVTRNITIKAAAGHEHNGVYGAGYLFQIAAAYGGIFNAQCNYITVQDIEIHNNGTGINGRAMFNSTSLASDLTMQRCIIRSSAIGSSAAAFEGHLHNLKLINCILESVNAEGYVYTNTASGCEILNCTAVNSAIGFYMQLSAGQYPTLKNCLAYNCATDYAGTENAASATCATTAASTTYGFVTVTGVSTTDGVDLTSPSTNDFSLTSGSALVGVGTDLSGTFTDDIAGNTRS